MIVMFRAFLATVVMTVLALAGTASAQTPTSATKSMSHIGFSQGVSASWLEYGPEGTVFVDFQISGGWDAEQSRYPQSPVYTSWRANEMWYSFSRTVCVEGDPYCQTLMQDYGPVSAEDLTFSGNEKVEFVGNGYSFVFTADTSFPEGLTQEMKHNQTTDGPFCWYSRQNSMRRGTATIITPDGTAMPNSQTGSAYTDWNVQHREGKEYLPICYGGGGKG